MFDFSKALMFLKEGGKVARKGWNGADMFAVYSPGHPELSPEKFWSNPLKEYAVKNGGKLSVRPTLLLKTAQNDVAYWQPSCSDILAEDWYTVE